jgi:hypothetical protein
VCACTRARALQGGSAAAERKALVEHIDAEALATVRAASVAAVRDLPLRVKERFDRAFKFDAEGVPREWDPKDDIRGAFVKARDAVSGVIGACAVMKITARHDHSPPIDKRVFSEAKRGELEAAFLKAIESSYIDAKRAQEAANRPMNVPIWLWGVLVIVGWNEFWTLVTSPLYLFTLLAAAAVLVVPGVAEAINMPQITMAARVVRAYTGLDERIASLTAPAPAPAQAPSTSAAAETEGSSAGGDSRPSKVAPRKRTVKRED